MRLHGPGDLRASEEADPVPAAGESLVRVTDVGLCGSDLHWFEEGGIGDATLSHPVVPGHEIAGVVEEGPLAGQPVALDPAVPCDTCPLCRSGHRNLCPTVRFAGHSTCDGGLRELMAWPSHLLHPLPTGLSTTDGALLEPLGVAIHAVDLGHLRPAARVAVVGCGPIGLLLVELALASGATSVLAVDPLAHRREAALRRGAGAALAPEDVGAAGAADAADVPEGGCDVVFEMAGGDPAVVAALTVARPGARVVLGGIPAEDRMAFPASLARRKGLTLAMVRRMKDDVYERGIRLVEAGTVELGSLVTARHPLEEADRAFREAVARTGLKVVVQPGGIPPARRG